MPQSRFFSIAGRVVEQKDDSTKRLLVAAALGGGLALTGLGLIIAFGIGAAGTGAILKTEAAAN